ncbi:hypothetical protein CORC01_06965 [Colletotrichum orchidophilum]|uniref:Uncharacterized protein n=1 Tax=Colletotrichum orchidophilum TaxID=1209926 RepID=A0A1G4B8I2_9PEZI|nr:uncharacterized protein CORC01_06965 [Colletotrichum orchidophilum]OHE97760.1 hypothetical protein CORC01_06965 [Colletotrichum orchidophilum]
MSIILPVLVFGLALQRLEKLDSLSEGNQSVWNFINGSVKTRIYATEANSSAISFGVQQYARVCQNPKLPQIVYQVGTQRSMDSFAAVEFWGTWEKAKV